MPIPGQFAPESKLVNVISSVASKHASNRQTQLRAFRGAPAFGKWSGRRCRLLQGRFRTSSYCSSLDMQNRSFTRRRHHRPAHFCVSRNVAGNLLATKENTGRENAAVRAAGKQILGLRKREVVLFFMVPNNFCHFVPLNDCKSFTGKGITGTIHLFIP